MSNLLESLKKRAVTIEDLQQYTRRNCLIVTGVPEEKDENTDLKIVNLAKENMSIPLEETDLDRSHRIGKPNEGKTRPIVVKFVRHNVRQHFIKNRKKLKGSRVGVQDLLTPYSQELLKKAKELVDQCRHVKGAWTWDGKVMVQVIFANDKTRKFHVKSTTDLSEIYDHGYPGPPQSPQTGAS